MALTVFSNGKFDILHSGHFNLLSYCRHLVGYKGYVIVGIDSDERVEELSGRPPIFDQYVRMKNLRILNVNNAPLIDTIHIFETDNDLRALIQSVKTDILVKGMDWKGKDVIGQDLVGEKNVRFFNLESNGTAEKISSSNIVETILQRHGINS